MNVNERENCFELFGFDFLLDEDFRIWLIEVNHNPFLGTPNDYMRGLVPRMIEDMLKIVVDPVLKPKNVPDRERPNDFELIWREASAKHGPPVNQRRSFSIDLIYPIPSLKPFIGKPKRFANSVKRSSMQKPQKPLDMVPDISVFESQVLAERKNSSPSK